MNSFFRQFFTQPHIAIDLGTANTRVCACEQGEIREEPSLVRHVHGGGEDCGADQYLCYLNNRVISSPLRGGVVVDLKTAVALLKPMLKEIRRGFRQPLSLACAPTDTSEKERWLLAEAILHAGASQVAIIPEAWAAAIGAGLDVCHPQAQLLIDIGEGVTDMAVIRDGKLVFTSAVRIACSDLQAALRNRLIAKLRFSPYQEEIKRLSHELRYIGRPEAVVDEMLPVRGMDILARREAEVEVPRGEILEAMAPVLGRILAMVVKGIQQLPDQLADEICESGICLTGGGSCITGMDLLLAERTGLGVRVAKDPIHSVINGAIQTLQFWKDKEEWWENLSWPQPTH